MNWIQPERNNPGFAMMQHQGGENKRRLSLDQVRALEMTFREDTKLEPAKKLQLARDLGLEPRQVAVWFQNRRVRSKNKQLEKDFQNLQQDYQVLKESYDSLFDEIMKLQSEVQRLSCSTSQEQEGPHESTATVSPCDEANNNHGGESNSTVAADMHENVKKKEAQQQQSDSQSQEYGQESMDHCSSLNVVELQQNSSGPGFWCSTDHWYSLDWAQ